MQKQAFTPDQAAAFEQLKAQLVKAGIDPLSVDPLMVDLVMSEATVAELRTAVSKARAGKPRAAASRALNVALAERRRLHHRLFARPPALAPDPNALTPSELAAAREMLARNLAWRQWWNEGRRTSEQSMIELHGPQPWGPLVYKTIEEEAATELQLEADHWRSRQPFERAPHIKLWLAQNPNFAAGRDEEVRDP